MINLIILDLNLQSSISFIIAHELLLLGEEFITGKQNATLATNSESNPCLKEEQNTTHLKAFDKI